MVEKNFSSDQPLKGIALAILATLLFAFLNSMTKHVSQVYPMVMILWFRYLFFCVYGLAVGLKYHKNMSLIHI